VVVLGRLDEHRVDVDADDSVASRVEVAANPTGTAPGVEDSRAPIEHRVDGAGLTDDVDAVGGQTSEPLDVPRRVARIDGEFLRAEGFEVR